MSGKPLSGRVRDTPLIQQYRTIKARHTDAVLFFRMGDFYEMFFDDARLAAREDKGFLERWHARWDAVEEYYFTRVRPRSSYDLVVTRGLR